MSRFFMDRRVVSFQAEMWKDGVDVVANNNASMADARAFREWAESRAGQPGWEEVVSWGFAQAAEVERQVRAAVRRRCRVV